VGGVRGVISGGRLLGLFLSRCVSLLLCGKRLSCGRQERKGEYIMNLSFLIIVCFLVRSFITFLLEVSYSCYSVSP
jgi:hypothetical protein